jgi:hypothetical protein
VLRPGFLVGTAGSAVAGCWLAWRAFTRQDRAARTIALSGIALVAMYALLLTHKVAAYSAMLAPVFAIALGAGIVEAWRRVPGRWTRVLIGLLLGAAVVEGTGSWIARQRAAQDVTPYGVYVAAIAAHVPRSSTVLGLPTWWFGLRDREYRSWLLAFFASMPSRTPGPGSVAQILDNAAADVLLVDTRMQSYLDEPHPPGDVRETIRGWIASRAFDVTATVDDPTYGRTTVYRR